MKKNVVMFVMLAVVLAGCGKTTEPVDSVEETAPIVEVSNEEETEEASYYTGYNHYIDPEEAMKAIDESDIKEDEQSDDSDKVGTEEASETEEETKVAEPTESTTSTPETAVPTPAPEAVTTVHETTPEPEAVTDSTPSTPDMSQLQEWFPPTKMLVVADATVVDENGNPLGNITKGSDIGVTGQCPGFYQVNYGAKRSFLPKSVLAEH